MFPATHTQTICSQGIQNNQTLIKTAEFTDQLQKYIYSTVLILAPGLKKLSWKTSECFQTGTCRPAASQISAFLVVNVNVSIKLFMFTYDMFRCKRLFGCSPKFTTCLGQRPRVAIRETSLYFARILTGCRLLVSSCPHDFSYKATQLGRPLELLIA